MLNVLKRKKIGISNNKYGFVFLFVLSLMSASAKGQPVSQQPVEASSPNQISAMPANVYGQKPGQVLIFVSSSMPQASLNQWFQQAQSLGASVILRGFVHHSLQDTRAWVQSLLAQQQEHQGGIDINPVAFEAYGISQVPAVVVTTGPIHCFSNENCQLPAFDVVYGNTSLQQALKTMSEKGGIGRAIAKQTLMQRKERTYD